jgi:hypothetical protein
MPLSEINFPAKNLSLYHSFYLIERFKGVVCGSYSLPFGYGSKQGVV